MLWSGYCSICIPNFWLFLRLWKLALDCIFTKRLWNLILPWSRWDDFLSQNVDSRSWTNQGLRSFRLNYFCFYIIFLGSWYRHQIVESGLLFEKLLSWTKFDSRWFQGASVDIVRAGTRTIIFLFRSPKTRRTFWGWFKLDTFICPILIQRYIVMSGSWRDFLLIEWRGFGSADNCPRCLL